MTKVTVVLTSGTSWTVPADFTAVNNIYCIGGGAGAPSGSRGAPGGGAFATRANVALTPGASIPIAIGA